MLHNWQSEDVPPATRKYVTELGRCPMMLLALDVYKLHESLKIQVSYRAEMAGLKGICAGCRSDRLLLAYSSWSHLLMRSLTPCLTLEISLGNQDSQLKSPGHS